MKSGQLKFLFKCCVSALFVAVLFYYTDWQQGFVVIADAHWLPLLVSLAGFPLIIYISAVKWHLLLSANGFSNSRFQLYQYYWVGMFVSNFLPSSVGGDLTRLTLMRSSGPLAKVAGSIFVERFTGLAVLLVFALLGLYSRPDLFGGLWAFSPVLVLAVGVLVVLFGSFKFGHQAALWLDRFSWDQQGVAGRVCEKIKESVQSVLVFQGQPILIGNCLLLSLVFYLVRLAMQCLIVYSLGLDLSFIEILFISPVIDVIRSVPLALNGLGVVEGAYVLFYSQVGILPAEALAFSIVARLLHVIATSFGGVFWLFLKNENLNES